MGRILDLKSIYIAELQPYHLFNQVKPVDYRGLDLSASRSHMSSECGLSCKTVSSSASLHCLLSLHVSANVKLPAR